MVNSFYILGAEASLQPASPEGVYVCIYLCMYVCLYVCNTLAPLPTFPPSHDDRPCCIKVLFLREIKSMEGLWSHLKGKYIFSFS